MEELFQFLFLNYQYFISILERLFKQFFFSQTSDSDCSII